MTWVKTGMTICSRLTISASADGLAQQAASRAGRTGMSQATPGRASGLVAKRSV